MPFGFIDVFGEDYRRYIFPHTFWRNAADLCSLRVVVKIL